MRCLRVLLACAIVGSCAGPPPAAVQPRATELTGRNAGVPVECVPVRSMNSVRVADGDRSTLVYGSGKTIWANPLGPGCGFGLNDIIILEPSASSYCRGDIVRSVDRDSHIPGPSCVLGDFIPYTRP